MHPEGTVEALLNDLPALSNILLYHVVSGKVSASDVVQLEKAESLSGDSIELELRDGEVYLSNSAGVIITDVMAFNGIIRVNDEVIVPR